MTRVRGTDMTREIRLSLAAKSIPLLIQPFVRCKICKKKATSYFATSSVSGGFVLLFCEPCFETLNVLYKREIRQREEEQQEENTILEDESNEESMKKDKQQNEEELID
jgi:hypothetical protein